MRYFVTGIDTGIGKSVASAVLVKMLEAAYWKPVQSGLEDETDSEFIKRVVPKSKVFPETYRLKTPASPHLAAKIDGKNIQLSDFKIPESNSLIIEGAGGLLVPLNEKQTILNLIQYLNIPVIIVSKNYLGSINHTLLTAYCLKSNQIPVKGILFNGQENEESERIICQMSQLPHLGRIDEAEQINKEFIKKQAQKLKTYWNQ
ncbi:MAG: dethiobiotin synthase [Bacteroidetes bacterium]|nr:MAG: dethiobiotin synthase [Bacteroidota bacterium]